MLVLLLLVVALAVILGVTDIRRNLVTKPIFAVFKKILPPLSDTEREAMEAGDVWWDGELFKGKPDWRMAVNGVLLASFMLSFLSAIEYISLANAIMLVYLAPPLSAFIAHALMGERLDKPDTSLIALSFFGFAMLQQFQFELVLDAAQLPGLVFGLLSLVSYSGFLLLNRRALPAHSQLQRTFYQLMIGACCVLPFLTGISLPKPDDIIWIALAGIFPGFIAIYCAIIALQHLPTRVYATLAYLEPVSVILAGWWLFNESLSILQLGGVLFIILTGLALALRHKPAPSVLVLAERAQL